MRVCTDTKYNSEVSSRENKLNVVITSVLLRMLNSYLDCTLRKDEFTSTCYLCNGPFLVGRVYYIFVCLR